MMKMSSDYIAYSMPIGGEDYIVCHPCFKSYASRWKSNGYEPDAWITNLNGDTIPCYMCEEEIA